MEVSQAIYSFVLLLLSDPMDQFILFGDSITQGSYAQERGFAFGAELTNRYVRRLDVINRGFSGYNTAQALKVCTD